jgi:hypothetical protein
MPKRYLKGLREHPDVSERHCGGHRYLCSLDRIDRIILVRRVVRTNFESFKIFGG